jgi:glycosyltransferase involved in cell wall biosynthesis
MKVLYFHQHFSTPGGATGTRSYEFARKLIDRGHEVTMVCGSSTVGKTGLTGKSVKGIREGFVDGIHVIEIPLPYSNYDSLFTRSIIFLRYSLKSVKIALCKDYDIIFATSTPLTAAIPGIITKLLKPWKKFVFEVRDLWPELPKAMGVVTNPVILLGMSILEKSAYITMDGGIGLSPGIKMGMEKRTPKNKPVIMIPNGCDVALFKPSDDATKAEKIRLRAKDKRVKPGSFVAVYTGAHGMANGLDAVLNAARVMKNRKITHIKFLFIGDGKLKPQLLEKTHRESLSNCIFFDPIPKKDLIGLMGEVDLGLMILNNIPAFYYGTSPNKFFDYIAMGLPVFINYPGWLAEMITENCLGKTVLPDDPEAFADALYNLSMNRHHMKKMGKNARLFAEKKFNRSQLANIFVDYLERFNNDSIL